KNRLISAPYCAGLIRSASAVEPRMSANRRLALSSTPPGHFLGSEAIQNLQIRGLRSQGDFPINFIKGAPMPLNGALHNLQRGADGRYRSTERPNRRIGSVPESAAPHASLASRALAIGIPFMPAQRRPALLSPAPPAQASAWSRALAAENSLSS